MHSVASIEPKFEQRTRKAKSGAKSFFQSMRNQGYTLKALKKLSKSLSTRSRKAESRATRSEQPVEPINEDQARSWDDGQVGGWAVNSNNPQDQSGDAKWGSIADDEAMNWNARSYFPSLRETTGGSTFT